MVDQRDLVWQIHRLDKRIKRVLAAAMPENTRIATDDNARIIMFLAHHRDRDFVQRDIEQRFAISPSTASRVLTLMEKKGLIARSSPASDARVKNIRLTEKANAIVTDLNESVDMMCSKLLEGFTDRELHDLSGYIHRLQANIELAITQQDDTSTRIGPGNAHSTITATQNTTEAHR